MAKHRLEGGWYVPSSGTRFFTIQGELVNVATGSVIGTVDRELSVGPSWDD